MKKLILFWFFIALVPYMMAQTLPVPEIVSVSVLENAKVEVVWKRPVADIDGYVIYEYFINTRDAFPVDTVNDIGSTTFNYPKVRKQPVSFSIKSTKGLINYSSLREPPHTTVFFQAKFDSCQAKVDLKWTRYNGWGGQLSHYEVYQRVDGLTELKGTVTDTTLSLPVIGNKSYLFFVKAVNINSSITSRSNDTLCLTKMPVAPQYVFAERASFITNNQVSIRFILDPYSTVTKYEVLASDSPDGEFKPVRMYNWHSPIRPLIHVDTLPGGPAVKYYKLLAYNNCGRVLGESNLATAIVPVLTVKDGQINLLWNEYLSWPKGINNYVVTRAQDGANDFSFSTKNTSIVDDIRPLLGKNMSGYFCYTVKAESNPDFFYNPNGGIYTSVSSKVCIDLSELVFVPNAFTPNADGVNDDFRPSFPFSPTDYSMVVFNRNGFKIFETTQPLKAWNGKTPNGKLAPEGTYIYFIKFSSQTGKKIEKKGSFSLIY